MENFGNERYAAVGVGDFLDGIDCKANEELNGEIINLRHEGYNVRVGEKTDPAYNNPDKIQDIYNYLEQGEAELKDVRKDIIHINLAAAALASVLEKIPFVRENKWGNVIDAYLEVFRDKLLYGKDQTDSQPWHNQRGSALTFLTIS